MPLTPQERIALLLPQVEEAQETLRVLQAALHQARLDAAPFKVGEVVEAEREIPRRPGERRTGPNRKEWAPAIVRSVDHLWSSRPSYRVSWRRKDGTWAEKVSYLYGGIRKAEPVDLMANLEASLRPEPEASS